MPRAPALRLEGELLRRLARWGATRGPAWFVRAAPPVVGLIVCGLSGESRRFVAENLRRVRGPRGALRDSVDVARTFVGYAECLTEVLAAGSPQARAPNAVIHGELRLLDALAAGKGAIFATAHTAGWEAVGPLLSRDHGLRVLIAERSEDDAQASAIQDEARRAGGVMIAHVGEDPLAALGLARHLREGGVVALQVDRVPPKMRSLGVTLFGAPARMPEGPLRLASLTGAPIVPIFAARTGSRRYVVEVGEPIRVPPALPTGELEPAAQLLAKALERFVRARPT
ncbi:MAG TPA: lysophospholipid acyltransferase family protein, partial [Polyangiaceae bacterium]